MSIVKISDKGKLDELIAHLTIRIGHRPTQQEVLDYCVSLGTRHLDELIDLIHPVPIMNEDKFEKIQKIRQELAQLTWKKPTNDQFQNDNDRILYGGN